jgi:succinyl-diaminopimelate desuccinylase
MDLNHALREALTGHRADILTFSEDLVRIASENPPGRFYGECVQRICRELEKLGFAYQVIDTPGFEDLPRANILAFHGEGRRTLYFHGHYDVVPARDPGQFSPWLEKGWLAGRGTADMKAGLAVMIYAAYLLKKLEVPLAGRIGLCIVADEETGGEGGSQYLDRMGLLGENAIGMLTPEPSSGVIWNANRGAISLRITIHGKPAHVGLQQEGINAFEQMLQVASGLQNLKAEVEKRKTSYHIFPDSAAYSILMLGGQVQGGTNFNVVPETCSFTLERRFNPEEDFEAEKARLFETLEEYEKKGIKLSVEVLQEGFSAGTAEDSPLAKVLAGTIEEVTGKPTTFEMCPGILETRWYARRSIPAYAYGPGLLELAHGPNEAVEMERVFQDTLIYSLVAFRLLAGNL